MVLLFYYESCSMSEAMTRMVEGTNVGFIKDITGKREQRYKYRTWVTPTAGEAFRVDGI